LDIEYFVFDKENMNIDVDQTKKKLKALQSAEKKLKIVMFGGSLFLFPHPVKDLVEAVLEVGATPCTMPRMWQVWLPAGSSRTRSARAFTS